MIALGGIIGAGLFVGSSAAIASAGPAILISYALTGLIVLLVMRMLGEMALAHPGLLGFTDYARVGLGNWAGFTTGWLYWFFWVVVVGVEAIAAGSILQPMTGLAVWQSGLLFIVAMTLTNLRSTRTYGEFEFWFASIKVGAILAFVLTAGLYLAQRYESGVSHPFNYLTSNHGFAPLGWSAVFVGVSSVIFTLVGGEIATLAAAESMEPEQAVAKLTVSLILRVTIFYVLSLFLILCIVPWSQIVPGRSPFVAALEVIGIRGAPLMMNLLVLTAALSALNSALYVTSRTLFVLAAHGDAPQSLVILSARQVPVRAILISTLVGYACVITSILSPQVVFAFLINASGAVILFVYALITLAQIGHRRRLERSDADRLKLKMWGFPWLSYAVLAVIGAILASMAVTKETAPQFFSSALALTITIAVYFIRHTCRSRH
jgi:L-asparagine transporter-like permease